MAGNRFGFPFEGIVQVGSATADGLWLSNSGAQTVIVTPSAACSISMPNPAVCENQTRTIINNATLANAANTITLRQYDAATTGTSHGGAILAMPTALSAGANAICSSAVSVAGAATNVYRELTVYCNGSTWTVVSGSVNPQIA